MSGIDLDAADARPNAELLALDPHPAGAVDQKPAEGAYGLVTCDQDGRLSVPEQALQVAAHPACITHAAGSHDDVPPPKLLQPVAVGRIGGELEPSRPVEGGEGIDASRPVPASLAEDLGHLRRHGGVQEDVGLRRLAVVHDGHDVRQQLLGALDGEGRDQERAPRRVGRDQLPGQQRPAGLGCHPFPRPVPVGRLQDQVIDPRGPLRIGHVVPAPGTKVAREQQAGRSRPALGPDLHRGAAEDVTRLPPDGFKPGKHLDGLSQLDLDELVHDLAGVGLGVDRLDHLPAAPLVAAVEVADLAFLDAAGIGEHDPAQVPGSRSGVDRAGEARLHEFGQEAGVIDVGMGQKDGVDLPGIEREGFVVQGLEGLRTLEHPAVHQHPEAGAAELGAGTGDATGGAVEKQIKRHVANRPPRRPRASAVTEPSGIRAGRHSR